MTIHVGYVFFNEVFQALRFFRHQVGLLIAFTFFDKFANPLLLHFEPLFEGCVSVVEHAQRRKSAVQLLLHRGHGPRRRSLLAGGVVLSGLGLLFGALGRSVTASHGVHATAMV